MSGNGPGPSGRGSRRSGHKKVATQSTKKLGRVAQLAIRHNEDVAEQFIDDLEAGRNMGQELGIVKQAFGGGAFKVRVGGRNVEASLRGMLKGRGRFHHNPEASTAVRVGAYVVMEGEQIMSALSTGQASRARRALGMGSARSSSSMGISFNRSSEERRNAVIRATEQAALNTRKNRGAARRSSSSEKKPKGFFSFW